MCYNLVVVIGLLKMVKVPYKKQGNAYDLLRLCKKLDLFCTKVKRLLLLFSKEAFFLYNYSTACIALQLQENKPSVGFAVSSLYTKEPLFHRQDIKNLF